MKREDAVDEAEMHAGIQDALRALDAAAEQAIRNELAKPLNLGHSGRIQFEIDPVSYEIHLVQTEETIVAGDPIPDGLFERAEAAGLDWLAAVSEEIVRWPRATRRTLGSETGTQLGRS